jgi:tetratricopeptide (TPR) repeat protein
MTGNPRAARIWHRDPDRALDLLRSKATRRSLDAQDLALLAWLSLIEERDLEAAERSARMALGGEGDLRFAYATLAEVLLRRGEFDEAIHVLQRARASLGNKWWRLTLADALIESGRAKDAQQELRNALEDDELRRHALKRLSRLTLEAGDEEQARDWFTKLVALAPNYLVYASDYVALAQLQLAGGETDAARETLRKGARMYPRNESIREMRARELGDTEQLETPRIDRLSEPELGVRRIPVRTPLISARTGLVEVIDSATRELREAGDVIAIGESPAAGGQGRLVPLELIQPSLVAQVMSRFVGKIGPLHSPEGMQGAILECGMARVLVAAVAGGLGKLIGRRGWFYRVAGPQAAMIDDVAACIPPFDHHMVYGPREPDHLASDLERTLGNPVAIVDANHLSGAWTVGASPGVDRKWVEQALADNPAGNEDEQTPVVILRPLPTARPGRKTVV